ncbi:permease-like cell division protein FtsX [Nocardioides cavernaquae]|uniref:Cell division protein FtsX n=1 Tax=Nocardioides cavernaquae TaxID=2321396 RepID=A0A3A5H2Z7_9ACTN|nr:permease-like cell division protein FtsX [Nocardioides cavernaquae]RJS45159.1 FtsX-like permease family protein [Nocardioides cavernaquae]
MQMTHVFTELKQGLRRNVSMHVAVVLTLFVSLTLVGLGALLQAQAQKAQEHFGDINQVVVFMCNDASKASTCSGTVSPAQKDAILKVVDENPEVAAFHVESQETAFKKTKELFGEQYQTKLPPDFGPKNLRESVWIDLKQRDKADGIISAVQGLDGVDNIRDSRALVRPIFQTLDALKWGALGIAGFLVFAALLLVANTIRLTAYARRREIGIMRLVGAGSLYIMLPFLLEALVTAVAGVALSAVALAAFEYFAIAEGVGARLQVMPWIGWTDYAWAIQWVAIIGPLLTVIPTLLLTRKYLKV